MNITFIHPWYLLFLMVIPALVFIHLYMIKFVKRRAFRFSNFEAIKRVGAGVHGGHILSRNTVLFSFRMVTVFFLILALSGMVFWYEGRGVTGDFVIAIDNSGSMLAKDFVPNRLDAAKEAANEFVDTLSLQTKVAVVTFSGTSFVIKDLDSDQKMTLKAIDTIERSTSGGTAVGDAIITSVNMFDSSESSKIIVLLTDGQNTVGTDVETATEYAQSHFVTVHTIGMATFVGAEFEGIAAVSKLDEETLKMVAEKTGGNFYRAENLKELHGVYREISTQANRAIPMPLTVPFIIISLLLVLVEWMLASLRYRILP